VCKPDSTGRTDRFYLLRCQCGTAGTEPRVHISIKSSYVVSDAEHCERTRYIERYLQPFIIHLYVHVWNLNRPAFFVSGVLLCEAPQRELYDCGAQTLGTTTRFWCGTGTTARVGRIALSNVRRGKEDRVRRSAFEEERARQQCIQLIKPQQRIILAYALWNIPHE
jgi:hypothetical protein